MAVITVTAENFEEEVLNSKVPVLVDFWASWCGYCRMLAPLVEQVSEEVTDAKFCKLDTDNDPDLADKYDVNSLPTLLVFKNGELVDRSIGFVQKDQIAALVK
ncbi:MAG: thioredoxin [Lachnospiraceae bacterium]|nr:thioredoxin [Lachnospiraceae bacterium]